MTKVWNKSDKDVHMMTLKELQEKFQVDISKGLSSTNAKELLIRSLKNQKKSSYNMIFKTVIHGLIDYFSIVLWVELFIFLILFEPIGGISPDLNNLINVIIILMCFVIKSIIIGLQEHKAIKLMRRLEAKNMTLVLVLRDAKWMKIPACELVVGDTVEINANDRVPADLRLVSVENLFLDKSILTGENEPIEASEKNFGSIEFNTGNLQSQNMAFTNFYVVSGRGQGIVVSLGCQNPTSESISNFKNLIYKGLNRFSCILVITSILSSLIYLIVWACFLRYRDHSSWVQIVSNFLNMLLACCPIGLSVVITTGLFIVVQKLRKLDIIVKNIFSVTSMSGIDIVLTDKTGTLTCNSVEVANVFYSTKELPIDLCLESPDVYLGAECGLKELFDLCDFCTSLDRCTNVIQRVLFEFVKKNRSTSKCLSDDYEIINEIEFNSSNKYQIRLIKSKNNECDVNKDDGYILMVRGAPDYLLPKCTNIMKPDGSVAYIDDKHRRMIQAKINEWSMMGRRLICLCKMMIREKKALPQIVNNYDFLKWFNSECNSLMFVGMVGFVDPPKPGIGQSIEKIRRMGVRVVVVTGDYSITAASIAKEIGILSEMKYETYAKFRENIGNKSARRKAIILNGTDIEKVKKGEWKIICNEYNEIILSRATPKHKLLCVKEFQSNGYSVMMVGDGINDVPALKRADLSVAMSSGSKLASLEAKVVLLNNSFDSIYELLINGRQTLINMKKVFLLSIISNVFSQSIAILSSLVLLMPQLYSNLQMTIVSGLTDVLLSIFLFFEKVEPRDMRRCKENLIDARLLAHSFLFLGPLTTFFAYTNFFLYFKLYAGLNPYDLALTSQYVVVNDPNSAYILTAQTVAFYTIVVMQSVGNLYSIRTRYLGFCHSNPFFKPYKNLGLVLVSIGIVLIISILLTFSINGLTMKIPPIFYATSIGFSVLVVIINELRKTVRRLRAHLYW